MLWADASGERFVSIDFYVDETKNIWYNGNMIRFDEENRTLEDDGCAAILVGLQRKDDISDSMEELHGLAEAAEAVVLGEMVQILERPNTATFIGKGKTEELAELCAAMGADTVIFNDELSGMQIRNLEECLGVRVVDRTILILDIFARRAISREGKLQVELAQLQYRLPRLTGFGRSLSRLGGGIGTRGPGETKLETDRRHIDRRIDEIKKELQEVRNTRQTQRARREKNGVPVVALVGYTNSGKSALMNRFLSDRDREEKAVFEKDMLFATLDTSQRRVSLENNESFVLIDTVGFVSKLPHALVEAFKATLEEVNYADLLLHVVDVASENQDFCTKVTEQVLKEIGAGDKERILVYNKVDLLETQNLLPLTRKGVVSVSAKYGTNIDLLEQMVRNKLFGDRCMTALLIPYDRGDVLSYLHEKYQTESVEYRENGTYVRLLLPEEERNRWKAFLLHETDS